MIDSISQSISIISDGYYGSVEVWIAEALFDFGLGDSDGE
jgi:hypothetical protein